MPAIFRGLLDRVKALFITTVAMDFEAQFLASQAERKAELLRQAARYEEEGLPTIAQDLRAQAECLSLQRPLASVLPAISHLQTDTATLLLPHEDRPTTPSTKKRGGRS